jgi:hypothetical protein
MSPADNGERHERGEREKLEYVRKSRPKDKMPDGCKRQQVDAPGWSFGDDRLADVLQRPHESVIGLNILKGR